MTGTGAAGFDAVAATYDAVAESALGRVLRGRVHAIVEPHLTGGSTLLDVGCGTGLDARHWVDVGLEVTAVDPSAEMRRVTAARFGPTERIDVRHGDLNDGSLRQLPHRAFDHVVANFGVLNCADDLGVSMRELDDLVVPGGTITVVVMGRCCPWEIASAMARLDGGRAARRWREQSYQGLSVRYPTWRDVRNQLPARLEVVHREALGWMLPTFEQRGWFERRPRLLGAMAAVDSAGARAAARCGVGDHWVAVLRADG